MCWAPYALSLRDSMNSPALVGNVDHEQDHHHHHHHLRRSMADRNASLGGFSLEASTHRTLSLRTYALYSLYDNYETQCGTLLYSEAIMDNTCIRGDGLYFAVYAETGNTRLAWFNDKTCSKVITFQTYGARYYEVDACTPILYSTITSTIQSILTVQFPLLTEIIPLSNPGILIRWGSQILILSIIREELRSSVKLDRAYNPVQSYLPTIDFISLISSQKFLFTRCGWHVLFYWAMDRDSSSFWRLLGSL